MPRRAEEVKTGQDGGRAKVSYSDLEARREALMQRLACLQPPITENAGYKTARNLLGSKYIKASLAARIAILEAAHFLITVLEITPFV